MKLASAAIEARRFFPGDRVHVDGEGLGIVTDVEVFAVIVRVDSDGAEVSCNPRQVTKLDGGR